MCIPYVFKPSKQCDASPQGCQGFIDLSPVCAGQATTLATEASFVRVMGRLIYLLGLEGSRWGKEEDEVAGSWSPEPSSSSILPIWRWGGLDRVVFDSLEELLLLLTLCVSLVCNDVTVGYIWWYLLMFLGIIVVTVLAICRSWCSSCTDVFDNLSSFFSLSVRY